MAAKVWRSDAAGKLFHDRCFEEGESREGFTEVKLEELADDDECDSCCGVFLKGLTPDVVVEDNEDDDDDGGEA